MPDSDDASRPHQRRPRYAGKNPRRYDQKYKELDPELDPETLARVVAAGKTPAGQHRPIMVDEILNCLAPRTSERGADVTFGYGGHSEALLQAIGEDGQLLAMDVDATQLPKTESRLRVLGYNASTLTTVASNYAALAKTLGDLQWSDGLDFLLADLGLSSMQIDNPERGFSYKHDGPLDMRMNTTRGISAADWLARCESVETLATVLVDGGDEPHAEEIADAILSARTAGPIKTTLQLRQIIESVLPLKLTDKERGTTIARTFQAIRIAVNREFSSLDAFLAQLPYCLRPGGRVAIMSFHSGEDRRVKHHFRDAARGGIYASISSEIVRAKPQEIAQNSRAKSAKLRWAIRS